MKYIKPLDSVRAIAVLLVITWHWVPKHSINKFPNGPAGVVIFFVLSGFLITRILLEGRNKTESTKTSKRTFFKHFYIRRALRIFPIYYLLVIPFFIYAVVHHQDYLQYFYLLTYTSNFYFYRFETWIPHFSHTWSLAVEEQFYILWPLIILWINKKYLLPCILLFILTGVASQLIVGGESFAMYLFFTSFDALGMGALLAWTLVYKPAHLKRFYKITGLISIGIVPLLYWGIYQSTSLIIPIRTEIAIIAVFVISYIVYVSYNEIKLPPVLNFILNNTMLASLGKISYGVYLYHVFIPTTTWEIIDGAIFESLPDFVKIHRDFFFISFNFSILMIISILSWLLIEKPLLRLKKHFEFSNEG